MPRFDPSGHPMLSEEASALSPEGLEAHADLAELVLGIREVALEDRDGRTAVALQVSYQIELDVAAYYTTGETRGRRSLQYRSNRLGELPPVHSGAALIVRKATAMIGWGERRGVR